MAFLEVHMVQVKEILRCWQASENKTAIGRACGVPARIVVRCIEAAACPRFPFRVRYLLTIWKATSREKTGFALRSRTILEPRDAFPQKGPPHFRTIFGLRPQRATTSLSRQSSAGSCIAIRAGPRPRWRRGCLWPALQLRPLFRGQPNLETHLSTAHS